MGKFLGVLLAGVILAGVAVWGWAQGGGRLSGETAAAAVRALCRGRAGAVCGNRGYVCERLPGRGRVCVGRIIVR